MKKIWLTITCFFVVFHTSQIRSAEDDEVMNQEFQEACMYDKLEANLATATEAETSLRNFIKKYPQSKYALKAYEELVTLYTQKQSVKVDSVKALVIIKEAFTWLHDLVKNTPEYCVPSEMIIFEDIRFPPVYPSGLSIKLLLATLATDQPTQNQRWLVNGGLLEVFSKLKEADYLRMVKAANYLGWEVVDVSNQKLLDEAVFKLKKKLLAEANFVAEYGFSPFLNPFGESYFSMDKNGRFEKVLTMPNTERMRNVVRLAASSLIVRIKLHRVGNQPDSKLLLYVKKLIEVGDTSAYGDVLQCLENKEQLETALDCVQAMAKYVVLDDNKKRVRFLPLLTKLQQDPELSAEVKEKVKACIEYITPYEQ
jgi:hypothetical protein